MSAWPATATPVERYTPYTLHIQVVKGFPRGDALPGVAMRQRVGYLLQLLLRLAAVTLTLLVGLLLGRLAHGTAPVTAAEKMFHAVTNPVLSSLSMGMSWAVPVCGMP